MEYNFPVVTPYSPPHLAGRFDTPVQPTYGMQDVSVWVPTLNNLRGQRRYLEDLLAKTVTKLNALRDKQTRNERMLNANPEYSRSRKKKMFQNKWRTNKTIQTCENEEKVILECLQVCKNNVDTLEAVLHPAGDPSAIPEYDSANSYTGSDLSGVQWTHGWTDDDDDAISPFETCRVGPVTLQEIAPEDGFRSNPGLIGDAALASFPYPLPLPPHVPDYNASAPSAAVPQLSAEAAVFQPTRPKSEDEAGDVSIGIDKLTISGLLSSQYMRQQLARRSFPPRVAHCSAMQPGREPEADDRAAASDEEQDQRQAELVAAVKRVHSV